MSTGAPNARDKAARVWSRPAPSDDAATAAAVVAHGLLGNLAVIRGTTQMLLSEPALADAERDDLLTLLQSQVDLVQGVLTDLVRGLPSQALAALDDLPNTR